MVNKKASEAGERSQMCAEQFLLASCYPKVYLSKAWSVVPVDNWIIIGDNWIIIGR